jgi:hypothetical protein
MQTYGALVGLALHGVTSPHVPSGPQVCDPMVSVVHRIVPGVQVPLQVACVWPELQ